MTGTPHSGTKETMEIPAKEDENIYCKSIAQNTNIKLMELCLDEQSLFEKKYDQHEFGRKRKSEALGTLELLSLNLFLNWWVSQIERVLTKEISLILRNNKRKHLTNKETYTTELDRNVNVRVRIWLELYYTYVILRYLMLEIERELLKYYLIKKVTDQEKAEDKNRNISDSETLPNGVFLVKKTKKCKDYPVNNAVAGKRSRVRKRKRTNKKTDTEIPAITENRRLINKVENQSISGKVLSGNPVEKLNIEDNSRNISDRESSPKQVPSKKESKDCKISLVVHVDAGKRSRARKRKRTNKKTDTGIPAIPENKRLTNKVEIQLFSGKDLDVIEDKSQNISRRETSPNQVPSVKKPKNCKVNHVVHVDGGNISSARKKKRRCRNKTRDDPSDSQKYGINRTKRRIVDEPVLRQNDDDDDESNTSYHTPEIRNEQTCDKEKQEQSRQQPSRGLKHRYRKRKRGPKAKKVESCIANSVGPRNSGISIIPWLLIFCLFNTYHGAPLSQDTKYQGRDVYWRLMTNPPVLGEPITLSCMILNDGLRETALSWLSDHGDLLVKNKSCSTNHHGKYEASTEIVDGNRTVYNLTILDPDMNDLDKLYICEAFGISFPERLSGQFIYKPKEEDIHFNITETNNTVNLVYIVISNVHPIPKCSLTQEAKLFENISVHKDDGLNNVSLRYEIDHCLEDVTFKCIVYDNIVVVEKKWKQTTKDECETPKSEESADVADIIYLIVGIGVGLSVLGGIIYIIIRKSGLCKESRPCEQATNCCAKTYQNKKPTDQDEEKEEKVNEEIVSFL